jgi:PilZ domain-containing protein
VRDERRSQPRYRFTAAAAIVELKSGNRIEAHIANISLQGCHVETECGFPLGAELGVSIHMGADSFVAQARVVFSSVKGMGLAFSETAQDQIQILETWIGPLREKELLALNRRRTQRVLMRVPVRLSGQSTHGSQFDEQTHTFSVSAHGASILLFASVKNGQRLKLVNPATGDEAECIVAHVGRRHADRMEVGVFFAFANPKFWHVIFPPQDWTAP